MNESANKNKKDRNKHKLIVCDWDLNDIVRVRTISYGSRCYRKDLDAIDCQKTKNVRIWFSDEGLQALTLLCQQGSQ